MSVWNCDCVSYDVMCLRLFIYHGLGTTARVENIRKLLALAGTSRVDPHVRRCRLTRGFPRLSASFGTTPTSPSYLMNSRTRRLHARLRSIASCSATRHYFHLHERLSGESCSRSPSRRVTERSSTTSRTTSTATQTTITASSNMSIATSHLAGLRPKAAVDQRVQTDIREVSRVAGRLHHKQKDTTLQTTTFTFCDYTQQSVDEQSLHTTDLHLSLGDWHGTIRATLVGNLMHNVNRIANFCHIRS